MIIRLLFPFREILLFLRKLGLNFSGIFGIVKSIDFPQFCSFQYLEYNSYVALFGPVELMKNFSIILEKRFGVFRH